MKDHPLLFTSDMIRALLEDRKTQTRRVPIERYRNWKVGERIWVREAWCYAKMSGYDARDDGGEIWYRATDSGQCEGPWKPSIHMFRKYARIFLDITGLREENAHRITEADVLAEGVEQRHIDKWKPHLHPHDVHGHAFGELWDSINAKRHKGIYAWDKNTEVKVIEFKRIQEYQ